MGYHDDLVDQLSIVFELCLHICDGANGGAEGIIGGSIGFAHTKLYRLFQGMGREGDFFMNVTTYRVIMIHSFHIHIGQLMLNTRIWCSKHRCVHLQEGWPILSG